MLVLETDFTQTLRYPQPFTCCLGYFDGLHKGHQALIHVAQSLGLPVGVLTFDRNPKKRSSRNFTHPIIDKKNIVRAMARRCAAYCPI